LLKFFSRDLLGHAEFACDGSSQLVTAIEAVLLENFNQVFFVDAPWQSTFNLGKVLW